MAKQSIETKARNAKTAKAKAEAKAKVEAKKQAAVADASKDLPGKVFTLQQQAGTSKKPDVDLAHEYSAPFDDSITSKRATNQRLAPTDAQMSAADKLIDAPDLGAQIAQLGNAVSDVQWKLTVLSVAIAGRVCGKGDDGLELANEYIKACQPLGKAFTAIRVNSIIAWMEHFAPLKWDKDHFTLDVEKKRQLAGAMSTKSGRARFVSERLAQPFYMFKPEGDYAEFALHDKVASLLKTASKYSGLNEEQLKAKFGPDYQKRLDLEGLEILREASRKLNALHSKQDGDASSEEAEESKAA